MTQNGHQPIDADRLRQDWGMLLASRPDLTSAAIATHTTLADSSVRNFLSGLLPGGENITREMQRLYEGVKAGDILPVGSAGMTVSEAPAPRRRIARRGAIYATQTVRKIAEVLDYCVENCAIGVITADFGVGKTEAVTAWAKAHARVPHSRFEFDEFTSANKIETVRMLCEELGVPATVANQNGGRAFRALCEHLRDHPCLLIFDQCEMLRPRVCQVIRQIWDRTADAGVGVVLLAAPIMLARMLSAKMVDLGALTSRVGIWAPLSGIQRDEFAFIVKQEGFADVDNAAFDLWFRACGGSMRRLMRSLDLLKSRHQGKRISEKTICGVAGMLWGMHLQEGL